MTDFEYRMEVLIRKHMAQFLDISTDDLTEELMLHFHETYDFVESNIGYNTIVKLRRPRHLTIEEVEAFQRTWDAFNKKKKEIEFEDYYDNYE